MFDTRQSYPLTDFLRNHEEHVAWLKDTRTPEVLSVDGRVEVVIRDAASYQDTLDRLHEADTVSAIREGIASAERGELKPAARIFEDMKAKYGIPD